MRYQSRVTDFVHSRALAHLNAAERGISAALDRPRLIAVVCVVTLTALGWLALALMAGGSGDWAVLCRPAVGGAWGEIALLPPMWIAMTLAMMLPTAGPMILTYAEIADTAARKGEPVVSPLVIAAGYLLVWFGFALAASGAQIALLRAAAFGSSETGTYLTGAILFGAGVYQFSALKHACLTQCQRPFPFFFSNWTTEAHGVFRLGLRQGAYCLGCCWAMMLVMLATGAMNVVWMAALGVLMTIEKMTATARFSRALGVAFIVMGLGFFISGLV
jgi:predicted metal-binding membrane protein